MRTPISATCLNGSFPKNQRTKLLGDSFDSLALLQMQGDAGRGRDLFFNAAGLQCRNCHRIGDAGRMFGADLNQVGKKYQRPELLESLVDPSKKIDPKYAAYVLIKQDGKVMDRTAHGKDGTGSRAQYARGRKAESGPRADRGRRGTASANEVADARPPAARPDRHSRSPTCWNT